MPMRSGCGGSLQAARMHRSRPHTNIPRNRSGFLSLPETAIAISEQHNTKRPRPQGLTAQLGTFCAMEASRRADNYQIRKSSMLQPSPRSRRASPATFGNPGRNVRPRLDCAIGRTRFVPGLRKRNAGAKLPSRGDSGTPTTAVSYRKAPPVGL